LPDALPILVTSHQESTKAMGAATKMDKAFHFSMICRSSSAHSKILAYITAATPVRKEAIQKGTACSRLRFSLWFSILSKICLSLTRLYRISVRTIDKEQIFWKVKTVRVYN